VNNIEFETTQGPMLILLIDRYFK